MDVIHTIENSTINYQCLKDQFQSIKLWQLNYIDTYFGVRLWNSTWLEKLKGNISDGKNAKQSTLEVIKSTK